MAYQEKLSGLTYEAGEDLSADQFTFMAYNGSGQVVKQTTAGGSCVGVLRTIASVAGRAVTVDGMDGTVVKIVAGATVAINVKVQSDTAGRAILAASGDHVQGLTLEAGVVGQIISVLLQSEHILA